MEVILIVIVVILIWQCLVDRAHLNNGNSFKRSYSDRANEITCTSVMHICYMEMRPKYSSHSEHINPVKFINRDGTMLLFDANDPNDLILRNEEFGIRVTRDVNAKDEDNVFCINVHHDGCDVLRYSISLLADLVKNPTEESIKLIKEWREDYEMYLPHE